MSNFFNRQPEMFDPKKLLGNATAAGIVAGVGSDIRAGGPGSSSSGGAKRSEGMSEENEGIPAGLFQFIFELD